MPDASYCYSSLMASSRNATKHSPAPNRSQAHDTKRAPAGCARVGFATLFRLAAPCGNETTIRSSFLLDTTSPSHHNPSGVLAHSGSWWDDRANRLEARRAIPSGLDRAMHQCRLFGSRPLAAGQFLYSRFVQQLRFAAAQRAAAAGPALAHASANARPLSAIATAALTRAAPHNPQARRHG